MKVLFDAFWWYDGPGANRTVMREFIVEWRRQFADDELALAVRSCHAKEIEDLPEGVETVSTRLWPQMAANLVELPSLARRMDADVVVAHNYAPIIGRSVVFVHDLLFIEHWDWFTKAERAYFTPMPWTQRRASVLATSSRAEARRMERLFPSLAPVHAVGLAVASELARARATRPAGVLEGPFSLIVGRLNVRKNLERAIHASKLARSVTSDQPLLIVGDSAHSGKSLGLPKIVEEQIDCGRVKFLGRVSDAELKWLYQNTALTLYLSLDEGFGLPPVEAASFGSPLVVSDIPVFRETVGDVATMVDPTDIAAIAEAIDSTFDPGRKLAAASEVVAARYNWSSSVRALRELAVSAARERVKANV